MIIDVNLKDAVCVTASSSTFDDIYVEFESVMSFQSRLNRKIRGPRACDYRIYRLDSYFKMDQIRVTAV